MYVIQLLREMIGQVDDNQMKNNNNINTLRTYLEEVIPNLAYSNWKQSTIDGTKGITLPPGGICAFWCDCDVNTNPDAGRGINRMVFAGETTLYPLDKQSHKCLIWNIILFDDLIWFD